MHSAVCAGILKGYVGRILFLKFAFPSWSIPFSLLRNSFLAPPHGALELGRVAGLRPADVTDWVIDFEP